ncbi:uncharacterized protein [Rhodnius prolixus]
MDGKTVKLLFEKLEEMRNDMKNDVKGLESKINQYQSRLELFVKKIETIEMNCSTMSDKIKRLKLDINDYQKIKREKNLILYNVPMAENEDMQILETNVLDIIKNAIKVEVNLNEIDRIVRRGSNSNNRPILIKFIAHRKKIEVLKSAKHLKGSNFGLSQDYSYEIRQTRKQLISYMKRAQAQQCTTSLRYDKLLINGDLYTLKQLQDLEEEEILSTGTGTTSEADDSEREGAAKLARRIHRKGDKVTILKWLHGEGKAPKQFKKRKAEQNV